MGLGIVTPKSHIPSIGLARDTVATWHTLSHEHWLIVQTIGIQCILLWHRPRLTRLLCDGKARGSAGAKW